MRIAPLAWKKNELVQIVGPQQDRKVPVKAVRSGADSHERLATLTRLSSESVVASVVIGTLAVDAAVSEPDALLREIFDGATVGLTEGAVRTRLRQVGVADKDIGFLIGFIENAADFVVDETADPPRIRLVEDKTQAPAEALDRLIERWIESGRPAELRAQIEQRRGAAAASARPVLDALLGTAAREAPGDVDVSWLGPRAAAALSELESPWIWWHLVVSSPHRDAVSTSARALRKLEPSALALEVVDLVDLLGPNADPRQWTGSLDRVGRVIKDRGTPALAHAVIRAHRRHRPEQAAEDEATAPLLRAIASMLERCGLDRDELAKALELAGPGPLPVAGNKRSLIKGVRRELIAAAAMTETALAPEMWNGLDADSLVVLSEDEVVHDLLVRRHPAVARAALQAALRKGSRQALSAVLPASEAIWRLIDDATAQREFSLVVKRDPVLQRLSQGSTAELERELATERRRADERVRTEREQALQSQQSRVDAAEERTRSAEQRAAHFEELARSADARASAPLKASVRQARIDELKRVVDVLDPEDPSTTPIDEETADRLRGLGLDRVGKIGQGIDHVALMAAFRFLTDERADHYEVVNPAWVLREDDVVTVVRYGMVSVR